MKTKLVNAELNSKKEAVQALIDGRVFSTPSGHKIRFDSSFSNPFVKSGPGFCGIVDWNSYTTWMEEVEAKWYENIPEEGILCWVWDRESDWWDDKRARIIVGHDKSSDYSYKSETGAWWKHATPVRPDECWQG